MLRSLQTSVRLLAICAILLTVTIVYLLMPSEEGKKIITHGGPPEEQFSPDTAQMDSAVYASYLKIKEGEKLFKQSGCYTCHEVCKKKVGPALKGVTKRRDREWIYKAVTNFPALRASGDKTAEELYKQFNSEMPAHSFLKKEDLDLILYFIDSSSCEGSR